MEIASARLAGPDLKGRADGFVDYRAASRRVELNLQADGGVAVGQPRRLRGAAARRAGRRRSAHFVWAPAGWSYGGTATSPRFATLGRVIEDDRDEVHRRPATASTSRSSARATPAGSIKGLVSVDTARRGPACRSRSTSISPDLSIHQLLADQFPRRGAADRRRPLRTDGGHLRVPVQQRARARRQRQGRPPRARHQRDRAAGRRGICPSPSTAG